MTLTRALASELATNPLKGEALAARAGVTIGDVRLAERGREGRRVSADCYLRLCAALGVRPFLSETQVGLVRSFEARADGPGVLSFSFLGMVTRAERLDRRHSVRDAAEWSGLSPATISVAEGGHAVSIETVVKLAAYVGKPASHFVQRHALGSPIADVSRVTPSQTG